MLSGVVNFAFLIWITKAWCLGVWYWVPIAFVLVQIVMDFMLENNFKPKSTLVTLGSSLLIWSNFLVLKLIVFYAYVQICPFTYHQSFKENHVFCLMNSKRFLSLSRVGQGIIKTATKTETHNGTCNFSRCVTVTLCTKR